jgi:hypothetical protein
MMHRVFRYLILCLSFELTACSAIPKAPDTKQPVPRLTAETSSIELHVDLPYSVIGNYIDDALPDQIFQATDEPIEKCPLSECTYSVRLLRNGHINITHNDNGRLVVKVPIRTADGRIDAMMQVLGVPIRKHVEFSADLTATAELDLSLQPDWSIAPDPTLSFLVHSADVHIPLAGMTITVPMRTIMSDQLNSQHHPLHNRLSRIIRDKVNIKPLVSGAWRDLHNVFKINEAPSLWLTLDPVSMNAANPVVTDTGVHMAAGMEAVMTVCAQQKAPALPVSEALPKVAVMPHVDNKYRVFIPVILSTDEITRQLHPLIGKEYNVTTSRKKITARISDIHVYSNGPDLVVYMEVKAKNIILGFLPVRIGAYLYGTPGYNQKESEAFLDPFDFNTGTTIFLDKEAESLLHGKIQTILQSKLHISIGNEISIARCLISDKITSLPLGNNLYLQGTVERLEPVGVYTTSEGVIINTIAEGRLSAGVR